MKRLLNILSIVSLACVALVATPAHATLSPWMKVTQVRAYSGGRILVYVDTTFTTTCSEKKQFMIEASHAGREEMAKLVLSAYLAGKQIRIDTSNSCSPSNDLVNYIDMR